MLFTIEEYDSEEHADRLQAILTARQLASVDPRDPHLEGVAVFLGEDLVAAGFIMPLRHGIALVDGYITNPESSPMMRDAALNHLTTSLFEFAKKEGYKSLLGWTRDDNTLVRAIKNGYEKLPDIMIFKRL